jgi:membrane protein DedA with SNARE-associated domain
MLQGLTQWLLDAIKSHGLLAVILGVAIETIIVPIPSPLILMAAGSVLIEANSIWLALFHALWISIVAGIAQTVGSYFVYGIAYTGGKPLIERFQRWHGISWDEIEEFQKKFKGRREGLMLFLLRAIPIMPLSIVSGVAGVIKMKWKAFSIYTFLGTIPRNTFLALLGWYMKEMYISFAGRIDHIETTVTILLILAIAAYIVLHKLGFFWKIRKKLLSSKE